MDVVIEQNSLSFPGNSAFEVVERKGLGHPDTICDALAETLSVRLCRFYLERFGAILHHNVDKALLCGGASKPAFGGGEVIEPIEIILAGRATRRFRGVDVPVEELARDCVRSWFREHFHALDPDRHVRVRCMIRPGSADLVELFARQHAEGILLANDTSCGVGFAPFTALETMVSATEEALNRPEAKRDRPEIGEDIKVMGIRERDRIRLTLACAFIDRHVSDVGDYLEKKNGVAALAADAANVAGGRSADIEVNTGDDPATRSLYLTVTGTSAEAGDDGEAGRGNRANGLITPFRWMTMEAAAGKNPVTHVGKLYNVAARRIATAAVESVDGLGAAECCLVSQIGRPVDDPAVLLLRLTPERGVGLDAVRASTEEIARDHVKRIPRLWKELTDGAIQLY